MYAAEEGRAVGLEGGKGLLQVGKFEMVLVSWKGDEEAFRNSEISKVHGDLPGKMKFLEMEMEMEMSSSSGFA